MNQLPNYDRWKLATPNYDCCCEDCYNADENECGNDDCSCHYTKEQWKELAGEAKCK